MQTASSVVNGSGLDWGVIGNLLVAFATLALVAVAVFQQQIHRCLRRPILKLSSTNSPPDSHKTVLAYRSESGSGKYDCYYLLLRVENEGKSRAEQVEVFLSQVSRQDASGGWSPIVNFLPQRLLWSFTQEAYLSSLSPGMHTHCTLGHILLPAGRRHVEGEDPNQLDFWGKHLVTEQQTVLCMDVQFRSNNLSHFLVPGDYRLDLLLASSQTKAVPFQITVSLSGKWFDSEGDMFREGVKLQVRS